MLGVVAQRRQEQVGGKLMPQGRVGAVATVHHGVRREAPHQQGDRVEKRVPVAAGQIGAPDAAAEQKVAAEQLPVDGERVRTPGSDRA